MDEEGKHALAYFILGIAMVVIGGALGAVGTYFAKDGWDQIKEARSRPATPSAEAAKFLIARSVSRKSYSGDVVVSPIGMFNDTSPLADGSPSGYTYVLCRFTNSGTRAITIGAIEDEAGSWFRLDDLELGYEPTTSSLAQWQMFFRGRPIDPQHLSASSSRVGFMDRATIKPGETRYAYINSLGRSWPEEITFVIIGATDTEVGRVTLVIQKA